MASSGPFNLVYNDLETGTTFNYLEKITRQRGLEYVEGGFPQYEPVAINTWQYSRYGKPVAQLKLEYIKR